MCIEFTGRVHSRRLLADFFLTDVLVLVMNRMREGRRLAGIERVLKPTNTPVLPGPGPMLAPTRRAAIHGCTPR